MATNGGYSDYRDEAKVAEVQRKISNMMGSASQDICARCNERVYPIERLGPFQGHIYHKGCFKCHECNQHLSVKTFKVNDGDKTDKNVYCATHQPKFRAANVPIDSYGIKDRMQAQELSKGKLINEQVRGTGQSHFGMDAFEIQGAMNVPKQSLKFKVRRENDAKPINLGSDAVGIKGALEAQKLRGRYRQNLDKHHFPAYVFKRREQMLAAQMELEERQRMEEDKMMEEIKASRTAEVTQIEGEIQEEWEKKLQELTSKYEKGKKGKKQALDMEKDQLAKSMSAKKAEEKKKRTLKLVEKERTMTAQMVAGQTAQMLQLLAQEKEAAKRELEEEIEKKKHAEDEEAQEELQDLLVAREVIEQEMKPREIPPPGPPTTKKSDLYTDPEVFKAVDEQVFKVAEGEDKTFTSLVHSLTEGLNNDLDKVRAIFRWITVKDLNVMEFDETLDTDNPLGLLRGIKYGNETYHTLFMRLCGYADIHCVEVKGHAKSVGYEPGMKIKEGQFNNTWNAVYVDDNWRLIQCNWGARHLVLDKDKNKQRTSGTSTKDREKKKMEKIRYQYDEHYFLTDPDEFILEFYPHDQQYQLLGNQIKMEQFIEQPFVRSVFFDLGMHFEANPKAVLVANQRGGAEVRIVVPEQIALETVFHYQLKFADRDRRHLEDYHGTKLERFVYQSTTDNQTVFSVHVPTTGEYFMEVFGNRMTDATKVQQDDSSPLQPFRLKCACKFRIVCADMSGKMHALPNCASGEWGPAKAMRHFNMEPLNYKTPIINTDNQVEVKFSLLYPLEFITRLRMNGLDDHVLEEFLTHRVEENTLIVRAAFPQPGQYGLDIYARPVKAGKAAMAHACKYLVNCGSVEREIPLPINIMDPWSPANVKAGVKAPSKAGPTSLFSKFGLKAVSHKEAKIMIFEPNHNHLKMEFLLPASVQLTFSLRRESEEDHRDNVTMMREQEDTLARFYITLLRPGKYVFALFARSSSSSDREWQNVYNYRMFYGVPDDASMKKKKK